jgi:hypothetical protein
MSESLANFPSPASRPNPLQTHRADAFWIRRRRIGLQSLLLPLAALAATLGPLGQATAPTASPSCSWPIETTGHGKTNVAFPDTDATYWLMPVDTTQTKAVLIHGQYPRSRFFSFTTYLQAGKAVDSLVDDEIAPDAGNTNPFAPGPVDDARNYTVTIDGAASGSGNHIQWGDTQTAFIIYRIYVADRGLDRMAGVPLPSVTLIGENGTATPVEPCAFSNDASSVQSLQATLTSAASAAGTSASCGTTQTASNAVLSFVANVGGGNLFPNPATTYLAARDLCLPPDTVVVVHGKAAVFPDTFNGGSIFDPALPGAIELRYWSLCNNEQESPFPVIACLADRATLLDDRGSYTYVIAPTENVSGLRTPPLWVRPGVNWLPWGDPTVANTLLFREMLPAPGFSLTGDFVPTRRLLQQGAFHRARLERLLRRGGSGGAITRCRRGVSHR